MFAVLCPGQGAQTPGFLAPWLEVASFAQRLETLGTDLDLDLVALGTQPDADVVDTAVAQPLLVAAALASAHALGEPPSDALFVGHSIGELAAASLAGAVTGEVAVRLARARGVAMASACADTDGGMTAVLGGDSADVLAAIERSGCVAANVNGAGQLVAAGPRSSLDRLAAEPPAGARLRPLTVAGAFHSPWMARARDEFSDVVERVRFAAHHRTVVSNVDGHAVTSGAELSRRLVDQVTAPVRFDLCLRRMRDAGVTTVVELAPAGVLAGLVRRELPDVEVVPLRTPDDLDKARALVSEHVPVGEHLAEEWRVVVAPAKGTFHPVAPEQTRDRAGVLGTVSNRGRRVDVTTEVDHVLVEWLAIDGDLVAEGQPVARIHATAQPVGAR